MIHIDSHRHDSKGKVHSWYGGNCHCHCNPSPLNGGKDISLDVKQIQRLIDATTRISYSQTTIHQKKIIVSLCVCVLKETFEYDQFHVQVDMDHSGSDAFVVVRIVYNCDIVIDHMIYGSDDGDVGCWCAVEIIMTFFTCIDRRMRSRLNDHTGN